MAAAVYNIGTEKNRVLVVDDFMDNPQTIVAQAAAMAPFPVEGESYYPGRRRFIGRDDRDSQAYVETTLRTLAPFLDKAFGLKGLFPLEASFCLVTTPPRALNPGQRQPHYDRSDPNLFAVLHYLSPNAAVQGGTCFYRHRATGFERISPDRAGTYEEMRREEDARHGPPPPDYVRGSNDRFERIARIEGRFNRVLVYRGSCLHSGDIPDVFDYSPDPATGRLTCNIFFQAVT